MSKHTPGPWTVSGDGQQVFCEIGMIANCAAQWHDDDDDEGLEQDANRNSANALFISAAPELYEACKAALKYLSGVGGTFEQRAHEMCEKAIAKAEGTE